MPRPRWRELVSAAGAGFIVLAIVGWSAISSLQDGQRQARLMQTHAQAKERGEIEALLQNTIERDIVAEVRARRQSEREASDLDAQWATAVWTFAQAAVGALALVGLCFTIWLSRLAWLESRESARQAKRSATIAQKQLIDARTATALVRETDEATARAYVSVTRATFRPPATHAEPFRSSTKKAGDIVLALENSGQTAAKNIVIRYDVVAEKLGTFEWKELGPAYTILGSNLAPKQEPADTLELHLVGPPIFQENDAVKGGDPYAVLRGEVRYTDVFGRRHRTAFIFWAYRGLLQSQEEHTLIRERVRMPAFEKVEANPAFGD